MILPQGDITCYKHKHHVCVHCNEHEFSGWLLKGLTHPDRVCVRAECRCPGGVPSPAGGVIPYPTGPQCRGARETTISRYYAHVYGLFTTHYWWQFPILDDSTIIHLAMMSAEDQRGFAEYQLLDPGKRRGIKSKRLACQSCLPGYHLAPMVEDRNVLKNG